MKNTKKKHEQNGFFYGQNPQKSSKKNVAAQGTKKTEKVN